MRLLILCLMLTLAGLPLATAESVKVGSYNVSFNMSQPHEIEIEGNEMLRIKTFDGGVLMRINDTITDLPPGEEIIIGGVKGQFALEEGIYYAYIPGMFMASGMGLYETVDFLQSLHITKEG